MASHWQQEELERAGGGSNDESYLKVNSHLVCKIVENTEGTARALYTQALQEAEGGGNGCRGRWAKEQLNPEEISALRQECASLKNRGFPEP